jgi:hypothetical protein
LERGRVLDLEQTWKLSLAWYPDPRSRAWRARSMDESRALLRNLGLCDEFWQQPA